MTARALSERALIVLLAAVTAAGPVALNIYMPVLPLARADFGVSVAAASTTVSAPLVAFALALLLHGPLSDHYGRRPVILGGLLVYVAGTVLALFAPTIGVLTAGRVISSVGTAAGVTVARAMIGDLFPRERMSQTIASLTMVMVTANSLAPVAGGTLAGLFGWRAVFVVLLVSAALITFASWRWLPETRDHGGGRDGAGVLRASLAVARDPVFIGYAFQSGVSYAAFFVFVSLMPYIVTQTLGRSSAEYGLWYLCISGGYFIGNWYVRRVAYRTGIRALIVAGVAIQAGAAAVALGLVLLHFWHPFWLFMPWGIIGFGQGLSLPNLTASAVALSPRYPGAASGLLGFSQQIMGAAAVQAMSLQAISTPLPVATFVAVTATLAFGALWVLPIGAATPGATR